MQILLANAKIMYEKAEKAPRSTPLFQSVTNVLAEEMARMDVEDLGKQLDCSKKIAAENWKRYHLDLPKNCLLLWHTMGKHIST